MRPPTLFASTTRSNGASFFPLIATGRPFSNLIETLSILSGAFIGQQPIVVSTIVIGVCMLSRSSASWERPAMLQSVE